MPNTFDPEAFARGLVEPVRTALAPFVAQTTDDAKALLRDLAALEKATLATLQALTVADDRIAKLLQDDLARYLPARKDAILARSANLLASDAQGALEAALTVVEKAAIIAAKAFIGV